MPCARKIRIRSRSLLPAAVVLLVLVLGPEPARALSITGLSITPTASNTANALANSGANRAQVASSTTVTGSATGPVADGVGATVGFDTRYASLVAADRESGGGSSGSVATSSYTIVFTVDNPTGADYRIDIDTIRLGAITLVSDGGGNASATLGAVVGTVDGLSDPTLALAAVGPQSSASSLDSPFSQSTGTLSIVQSAISKSYTLGFQWTSTTTSSQDEVAIRMGLAGGLTSTTADDYPGVGARTAANDGHFVSVDVTILPVPEPGTGLLVGLGLLVLALIRDGTRRRARA